MMLYFARSLVVALIGIFLLGPFEASARRLKRQALQTPQLQALAPYHFQWPDPSYGPGTAQFRALQRAGRCVIDEGYGRYSFCGNR